MNDTYIAQCEKAKLPWEPKIGDRVCVYDVDEERIRTPLYILTYQDIHNGRHPDLEWIPLWSQEQLWARLPDNIRVSLQREGRCYWTIFPEGYKGHSPGGSYTAEEALFKLVMLINHNKTWQDGEWV